MSKLKDTIHQIHMANSTFNAMNGNCMSCHAIDDNGDFVLWDDVKYDQYKGYKLVSVEDAGMEVSYDQDTCLLYTSSPGTFTTTWSMSASVRSVVQVRLNSALCISGISIWAALSVEPSSCPSAP